jgi:hypothetical protein
MTPLITAIINTLAPFQQPADAQSVPVPGAGTVVSPVTTITNSIGVIIGAVLAAYGVSAASSASIAGGVSVVLAALLNQLHITGGANVNTLASSQNPTILPVKDQTT